MSNHIPHTLVRIERIFGLPIFSEAPFGDDFLVIKGVGNGLTKPGGNHMMSTEII
eukprot:COSAG06_NODE_30814_length_532_cov_0.339492_1_plen_55_part_00